MLAISQVLQCPHQLVRIDPQVAQQDHQAAARQALGQAVELVRQIGKLSGLDVPPSP